MIAIQVEEADLYRLCCLLRAGYRDEFRGVAWMLEKEPLRGLVEAELIQVKKVLESIQAQIPEELRPFERPHE